MLKEQDLITRLSRKGASQNTIANQIIKRPELLPQAFDGLADDRARVKYGCLKVLKLISEGRPDVLYSHLDRFIELLDSENNILLWGATAIISNLAGVDRENRIEKILSRYLRPISGHVMISAANAIGGAGRIAAARPELADPIARQVLKVESGEYQTAECRNIAIGHAIDAFERMWPNLRREKKAVAEFVQRQIGNSRSAVRKRAERMVKRWGVTQ